jgi:hypothetical protein
MKTGTRVAIAVKSVLVGAALWIVAAEPAKASACYSCGVYQEGGGLYAMCQNSGSWSYCEVSWDGKWCGSSGSC